MPDPISWYALGRTVGDITTIDEEIDTKILTHNLDASAHGQSDEAVYNHRISTLLDHVNYSIYNIKMHPETRPIKAFVDSGGAAEFSDIQAAIDYVHALGGGKIFIKEGTYTPGGNIIMYSDIQLEGDDDDTTIIDFEDTGGELRAVGNINNYVRNMHISHLQIKRSDNQYEGAVYFEFVEDSSISFCQFFDNYKPASHAAFGVGLYNCVRVLIENNKFQDNYGDVIVVYGWDNIVRFNRMDGAQGDSILYSQTDKLQCLFNIISNVYAAGILCEDTPDDALIQGNRISGVGYACIALTDPNRVQILDNHLENSAAGDYGIYISDGSASIIANNYLEGVNTATGIDLESGQGFIIANNYFALWNVGVYISAGSDRNMVHGNHIYQDVTTKITNNGTNTLLADNLTA